MSQEVNRVEENQMFEIIDDEDHSAQAIIKVIGIGGGGGNAINYMIEKGLTGAEFIAMNTDAQALRSSKADIRLQLGSNITNGLGAGANPEIGYKSALEDKERIREIVTGADVVFIAAGMGGGTGTGACPVVAEIAKEEGALTIGVVSKPSMFEGRKRMNYATQGIARLSENIDSLLIIPNDKLQKSLPRGISFLDALSAANGVLYDAVSGFSSIINNEESTINIDFADVRTVMTEAGTTAVMGIGVSAGENRAEEAVEEAISCPLLEDVDLSDARGVLVHIVAGIDFSWDEYHTVGDALKQFASEDSQNIIGVTVDPTLESGELHVTVIVTGIGERKSELNVVKNPTLNSKKDVNETTERTVAADNTSNASVQAEEKALAKATEEAAQAEPEIVEPIAEVKDKNSAESYLDIPAFLRRQADN
ncbi:cell division protein FtsZ [Psychromonas sp. 14N.309.X.WAT.B.A12]|uniref:cell division protein FtsZ n=1 Tax=unclassified Psychromonas TaxID=2614957 RepID=UPI0025B0AFE6|nr:cell division protein FtsZ [Psychromonas sp. 14N.309.X.WAT.B.A12]MDN2663661.1 cell division protein FtsZ [Psychromonas sp. 14N.309.X.WAT.B.A12]